MRVALTREVSSAFAACELTHLPRVAINVARAREQHRAYEKALDDLGCLVERLPAGDDMPDSVFIEDIAVVVDELAVITRPGAEARRRESLAVADALSRYRPAWFIDPPGTLDGGDVLVAGRRVFVGRSARTNDEGVDQLRRVLAVHGYSVVGVRVTGCLHLKSAVTAVGDNLLLMNPGWVSREAFAGFDLIDVHPGEADAANALKIAERVVFSASFPLTADTLRRRGIQLRMVDASELAKAEGAVTCCSLIFESEDPRI